MGLASSLLGRGLGFNSVTASGLVMWHHQSHPNVETLVCVCVCFVHVCGHICGGQRLKLCVFYYPPLFWGVLWNRELPYSDRQLLVVPRSTHLYQLPTTADATDVPCRIWLSHGCWGTELWPLDCEAALHLQNHFPSPSTEHLWSHLERGTLSQPQLWAFMEPLEEGCPFSFCNKISSEITEVEGR